jgi:hypothetical protein
VALEDAQIAAIERVEERADDLLTRTGPLSHRLSIADRV